MKTQQKRERDQLLEAAIKAFDIPDDLFALAVRRYEAVGRWLSECSKRRRVEREVYPQGSFRLGTVVQPLGPRAEYDIDMVDRINMYKASISQVELKQGVGNDLAAYLNTAPEGRPKLKEGKRCWTLEYQSDPFHMDVLPAIPDPEGRPNAMLLTDRDVRNWQHSNPIDYAEWFHEAMVEEFDRLRASMMAQMQARDVEEVPAWQVKTTLQRTVQALKRHRDLFFMQELESRPASIIITTLAAESYRGGEGLYEVLRDVTQRMPDFVQRRGDEWWVPNPVQPAENFADRWRERPELATAFFKWLARAQQDFGAFGAEQGADRALEALSRSFGNSAARSAAKSIGSQFAEAGQQEKLGVVSAVGALGITSSRPAPRHTFHGESVSSEE